MKTNSLLGEQGHLGGKQQGAGVKMILSLQNMRYRKDYLGQLISEKTLEVKNAPQGTISAKVNKGNNQYYYHSFGENSELRYLTLDDRSFATAVAQRQYDEKVIKAATKEGYHLQGLIRLYESGTVEDIYDSLAPARKALVTPILIPDEEFVRNWLAQPYEGLGFEEGFPLYVTDSGLRVRSKSEIAIANKYEALGIPMRYEKPVFLKGWGTVYSDFSLLNVRLRKEYIHEHLGMMDDSEYVEENVAKIKAYERNGYFPGKNLILTFETRGQPFDAKRIADIAEQYLL